MIPLLPVLFSLYPYDPGWTFLGTGAAAYAFFAVYPGKVIFYYYCAVLTGALTGTAGNTSCVTGFPNCLSLVIGAALYPVAGTVGDQLDQAVGTGGHAFSAGFAGARIYLCDAV